MTLFMDRWREPPIDASAWSNNKRMAAQNMLRTATRRRDAVVRMPAV